jgi:hypothetical protein
MANDCIPFKRPGLDVTGQAEGAITGKRCVQISGARTSGPGLAATAEGSNYVVGIPSTTGAAGAGKRIFGVAKYDAADGAKVGVIRAKRTSRLSRRSHGCLASRASSARVS